MGGCGCGCGVVPIHKVEIQLHQGLLDVLAHRGLEFSVRDAEWPLLRAQLLEVCVEGLVLGLDLAVLLLEIHALGPLGLDIKQVRHDRVPAAAI